MTPLIDLGPWLARRDPAVGARVDAAFRTSGFLLLDHHGIDLSELDAARDAAWAFFRSSSAHKQGHVGPGPAYRGWFGPGTQANGPTYGVDTPPDLKETFAMGPETAPTGVDDPATFGPNVFPVDGEMAATWTRLHQRLEALGSTLVDLCEVALGLPTGEMQRHFVGAGTNMVANWYPARSSYAEVPDGAMRIGPHTDFGTLTILDRRSSPAGLQIDRGGAWVDVPWVRGTLTVNVGDLLSHWTGGRWRSTLHRIQAPDVDHESEELLSMVMFHRPASSAVIEPIGGGTPIRCGDWMDAKMAALAVEGKPS